MPRTRLGVRLIVQALRGVPLPARTLALCRAVPTARDPRDPSGSRRYVGRSSINSTCRRGRASISAR